MPFRDNQRQGITGCCFSIFDRVAAAACRFTTAMLDVQARAKGCCAVTEMTVLNTRSPETHLAAFLFFVD